MLLFLTGLLLGTITMMVVYGAYMLIIAFTLWMVVDAAKQDRFWWVVLTVALPVIGPAVYYYTEKKHEYAKVPSHHIHDSETESQHEVTPKHHTHTESHSVAESKGEDKKESQEEKKAEA